MIYTPEMTLGEARERYFELAGFGPDGGYNADHLAFAFWVMAGALTYIVSVGFPLVLLACLILWSIGYAI